MRRHRRAALVRQDRQRGAHRGRPRRARDGAAPRHRQRHARRAAAPQPRAPALAHGPQQQLRHRRPRDRILIPPRWRLDRPHHRAQGRAVRHRLPHAVPGRRHRRHQALLPRHADPVRPPRARLPAGHRRRRSRRLQGHLDDPRQAGLLPAHRRLAQSRSQDRPAGGGAEGARQQHRHGRHGLHGLVHGGRLPHRGRLLPHRRHAHERAHVLPVLAPRHRAHLPRRPRRVPHRSRVVHGLHAPRYGGVGAGRQGRSRASRLG